ncbi:MAG: MoxR family ATPase [Planctomycetota bacterium]
MEVDVREQFGRAKEQLGRIIVGQDAAIEEVLCALLAGGHVLVQGVPGVAKTLLARALAGLLTADYRRIQFTPDLMPADVVGTLLFAPGDSDFRFRPGPIFTQVLLADEINRTPPKTQAALLEAMEEGHVTVDTQTHSLPELFFVLATQNPLEYEGTYPLPEAQLDRFLLRVDLGYLEELQEVEVLRRHLEGFDVRKLDGRLEAVWTSEDVASLRAAARTTQLAPAITHYIVQLTAGTRSDPRCLLGASPRAAIGWMRLAQVRAAIHGRKFVLPEDVQRFAGPVLRHRLIPTPEAELTEGSLDELVAEIVARTPVPGLGEVEAGWAARNAE